MSKCTHLSVTLSACNNCSFLSSSPTLRKKNKKLTKSTGNYFNLVILILVNFPKSQSRQNLYPRQKPAIRCYSYIDCDNKDKVP